MIVYRCIPDFEGILSGIYDIWSEGRKAEEVRLELCDAYGEVQLFTQYLEVERTEIFLPKYMSLFLLRH